MLLDFKIHCKATVIKKVQYLQKNRQINHWDRIQSPEIDLYKYRPLIFDKGAKAL